MGFLMEVSHGITGMADTPPLARPQPTTTRDDDPVLLHPKTDCRPRLQLLRYPPVGICKPFVFSIYAQATGDIWRHVHTAPGALEISPTLGIQYMIDAPTGIGFTHVGN